MRRWCLLDADREVEEGRFREARLVSQSGGALHTDMAFLNALAERVMQRYEGEPVDALLELPASFIQSPNRTKRYYHLRLYNEHGGYTRDFITEASETLALWLEESLGDVLYAQAGKAHNSDPAYDVLSIFLDEQEIPRLRVVQVKATQDNLQGNGSEAVAKFGKLERGEYDPQLSTELALIAGQRRLPDGLIARELAYARRYRVTAVHAEDRDQIRIMTAYDDHVPGGIERRSVWLIRIDWPNFWEALGAKIYAQLA